MPIEVQLFSNNAVSLLAVPLSASDTSLVVMSGYGALFPNPGPNEYFLVTLEDQTASRREIIKVRGRTGDTLTGLVRGQEGTPAQSWGSSLGDDTLVDHRITAETMDRALAVPPIALDDLTDVNLSTPPTAGQVLKFNGTQWVAAADNAGVPSLGSIDGHTDVNTTSTPPSVGQVLKWNGTQWVPASDNAGGVATQFIDQLLDVDTSTVLPTSGQVLKWNGTNWAPAADNDTVFNPATTSINAFADVDTASTAPTIGQVLKWNGTNWAPASDNAGAGIAWINGENTNGTNIDQGWRLPISVTPYSSSNRTFKYIVTVTHNASFTTRAFEVLLTVSGNLGSNSEVVHATQYATVGPAVQGDLHAALNTGTKILSLEWENTEASPVTVNVVRIQHQPG